MPLHWFHPPVRVELDRVGHSFAVSSVEKATELLLKWSRDTEERRLALATCAAAIKGEVDPDAARAAFEAAAKADGRLM